MTSNRKTLGRLALLPALALLPMPAVYAQEAPQRGVLEIGVRALAGDRSSSQFNEYRDLRPGLFIRQASLDLENLGQANYFLNFQTTQSGQNDQHFLGVFGKRGKFGCEVRRDGTPHDFTNTAATLFTESSPGVFTIPAAIRTSLAANPASISQILPGARAVDVALVRKLTGVICQFTPSAAWTLFAQFSQDAENGYRPLGTTLNDETNVVEQMEPVDYRTHDVKAGAEYAGAKVAFEAGYSASIFHDQHSALSWD